jgi:DNA polymerase-1
MQHFIFEENNEGYKVAILIKTESFNKRLITEHYVDPLVKGGIPEKDIIAFDLLYAPNRKIPVNFQKAYLADLLPELKEQGIKLLMVADGAYFKTLTKQRTAEPHHGYVLPCAIKGFEDINVVMIPNHAALFYNPDLQAKINMGITTVTSFMAGKYAVIGTDIIHNATYVTSVDDIKPWIEKLLTYDALTCDTETYSLNFWKTGIGTIGFAWDKNNGVVFQCDKAANLPNEPVKEYLKDFFTRYLGKLIYHNANFDMKIIINSLFMAHLLDEKGKQEGIELLTRDFDCTKIITYLATNSTAGNNLKLKEQAHEFAGNYAQEDIKDITLIPLPVLMEYNLVDCLSTWFVREKHYPTMVTDDQLHIYETIMKPSVKVILQAELTGMPVCMKAIQKARTELCADIKVSVDFIDKSPVIDTVLFIIREEEQTKANAKLKKKVKPLSDFEYITFNCNSDPHLRTLFFDYLELPVLEKTDGGQASCAGDVLKALVFHTDNQHVKDLLKAVSDFVAAEKILNTFIAALEKAVKKSNGHYYLHGNFNIGGTVSGRLSSSVPNLQNIPSSGTKYAKIIKQCFLTPPGWLFVGADFALNNGALV